MNGATPKTDTKTKKKIGAAGVTAVSLGVNGALGTCHFIVILQDFFTPLKILRESLDTHLYSTNLFIKPLEVMQ